MYNYNFGNYHLYPLELDCQNLEDDGDADDLILENNLSLDSFQEPDIYPSDIEGMTGHYESLPADDTLPGPSGVQSFGAAEPNNATRPTRRHAPTKQPRQPFLSQSAMRGSHVLACNGIRLTSQLK